MAGSSDQNEDLFISLSKKHGNIKDLLKSSLRTALVRTVKDDRQNGKDKGQRKEPKITKKHVANQQKQLSQTLKWGITTPLCS